MEIENLAPEIANELLDAYGITITDLSCVHVFDVEKLTKKIINELRYGLDVDISCKE